MGREIKVVGGVGIVPINGGHLAAFDPTWGKVVSIINTKD